MIELGNYNTLEILRDTSVGLFLGDGEGTEVLLPNKYVPEIYEIGDELTVFCYLDHEERPVTTNIKPYIIRNTFNLLRVAEVNNIGAFMDWGLENEQKCSLDNPISFFVIWMTKHNVWWPLTSSINS